MQVNSFSDMAKALNDNYISRCDMYTIYNKTGFDYLHNPHFEISHRSQWGELNTLIRVDLSHIEFNVVLETKGERYLKRPSYFNKMSIRVQYKDFSEVMSIISEISNELIMRRYADGHGGFAPWLNSCHFKFNKIIWKNNFVWTKIPKK